nr:MAG TPA: hypothetical protein [Bacteriophage sp.]
MLSSIFFLTYKFTIIWSYVHYFISSFRNHISIFLSYIIGFVFT